MKKLARVQTKNGTKSDKPKGNGYTPPKVAPVLKTLQVHLIGKGWTNVTAPTTDKVISGVKRYRGFQYRTV